MKISPKVPRSTRSLQEPEDTSSLFFEQTNRPAHHTFFLSTLRVLDNLHGEHSLRKTNNLMEPHHDGLPWRQLYCGAPYGCSWPAQQTRHMNSVKRPLSRGSGVNPIVSILNPAQSRINIRNIKTYHKSDNPYTLTFFMKPKSQVGSGPHFYSYRVCKKK